MAAALEKRIRHQFLDACEKIRVGSLFLTTPEGTRHRFGEGEPVAELHLHDWSAIVASAARGDIGFGEAYIAGLWDTPSIEDLTVVAIENYDAFEHFGQPSFWSRLKFRVVDQFFRANSRRGSSRNIKSHYDVGNEFYQLWLDRSMTYSSAIFEDGDDLEKGQERKYQRILSRLEAGENVLEVGCGWGGFAEAAAESGRNVTGITISPLQKSWAEARLDGRADIQLRDYRDVRGTFDNIVSIEMIEAVGERYWPSYFSTISNSLSESGRAVIQAITVPDSRFPEYRKTSDFIRQNTFPGGMLVSDGVIRDQAAKVGLKVDGSYSFGQDYARTCREWANRLRAETSRVLGLGYDQAFMRSWLFYLEICAAGFATDQTDVVQVELVHA